MELSWLVPYLDYLFLVGAGALDISFLPTLLGRHKPDRWTSIVFAVVLAAFTLGFLSMGLTLSAAAQGVGALMWAITIFQRRR